MIIYTWFLKILQWTLDWILLINLIITHNQSRSWLSCFISYTWCFSLFSSTRGISLSVFRSFESFLGLTSCSWFSKHPWNQRIRISNCHVVVLYVSCNRTFMFGRSFWKKLRERVWAESASCGIVRSSRSESNVINLLCSSLSWLGNINVLLQLT